MGAGRKFQKSHHLDRKFLGMETTARNAREQLRRKGSQIEVSVGVINQIKTGGVALKIDGRHDIRPIGLRPCHGLIGHRCSQSIQQRPRDLLAGPPDIVGEGFGDGGLGHPDGESPESGTAGGQGGSRGKRDAAGRNNR